MHLQVFGPQLSNHKAITYSNTNCQALARLLFLPPLFFLKGNVWEDVSSPLCTEEETISGILAQVISVIWWVLSFTQSFSSEAVPVTSRIILHIRKWACDVKVKVWQQASLGRLKVYKWPSPIGCFSFLLSFAGHAKLRYSERPFWGTGCFF